MAWLTVPALIGPVLGPPVGGFITTYSRWRWIFWINVPIGVLGIVLVTLLHRGYARGQHAALDWLGFVSAASGLAGLVSASRPSAAASCPAGVGAWLLAVAARLHRRSMSSMRGGRAPVIDLRLLRIRDLPRLA